MVRDLDRQAAYTSLGILPGSRHGAPLDPIGEMLEDGTFVKRGLGPIVALEMVSSCGVLINQDVVVDLESGAADRAECVYPLGLPGPIVTVLVLARYYTADAR
jgi:hypothetical protein